MMPPLSPDQPHTILVATSPAYDTAALGQALARYHFEVQTVGRGDEALSAVGAGGVTLVLLDVALAGSAGLELCQRLKQSGGRDLPVYLLSARPSAEERERATEAGAEAYLPMSFSAEDLAEKILLQLHVITPAPLTPGAPTMASLEVNYHTMLAGSPDAIVLMERGSNRVLDVNRRTRQLFNLTETELI